MVGFEVDVVVEVVLVLEPVFEDVEEVEDVDVEVVVEVDVVLLLPHAEPTRLKTESVPT
jgi:hypothetical protein